jgi:hypothetical protein
MRVLLIKPDSTVELHEVMPTHEGDLRWMQTQVGGDIGVAAIEEGKWIAYGNDAPYMMDPPLLLNPLASLLRNRLNGDRRELLGTILFVGYSSSTGRHVDCPRAVLDVLDEVARDYAEGQRKWGVGYER